YFLITENCIFSHFKAKRQIQPSNVTNISKPKVSKNISVENTASQEFLQYLVNRKSQQAFAFSDGEIDEANEIMTWFSNIENFFSKLFDQKLHLSFDRENLNFVLKNNKGNSIDISVLSDGYSAIIEIITDLIVRMEGNKFADYNQFGIVLIDEIETHLHVSLQKQILPMLKSFFPNIRFIITTHSPFVLSSIEEVIIYDMEHKTTISSQEKMWAYSYEALVDGYFEVEKYSETLKEKIKRYRYLIEVIELGPKERKELRKLKKELENVPSYKNPAIEHELKLLGLK
uniref:AAA family ATPase n=1 Tax=Vibrio splendidus TaxID=29497 RepID=UPI000CB22D9A